MSKERLEEIRTRLKFGLVCLKHLRREILNSDDESLKYQVNLLENDIRYLFKQAKRVHELEDKLELVMDRRTYLEGDYYSLQQQNKRYREALDIMLYHADNEEVIKDVYETFVGGNNGGIRNQNE